MKVFKHVFMTLATSTLMIACAAPMDEEVAKEDNVKTQALNKTQEDAAHQVLKGIGRIQSAIALKQGATVGFSDEITEAIKTKLISEDCATQFSKNITSVVDKSLAVRSGPATCPLTAYYGINYNPEDPPGINYSLVAGFTLKDDALVISNDVYEMSLKGSGSALQKNQSPNRSLRINTGWSGTILSKTYGKIGINFTRDLIDIENSNAGGHTEAKETLTIKFPLAKDTDSDVKKAVSELEVKIVGSIQIANGVDKSVFVMNKKMIAGEDYQTIMDILGFIVM